MFLEYLSCGCLLKSFRCSGRTLAKGRSLLLVLGPIFFFFAVTSGAMGARLYPVQDTELTLHLDDGSVTVGADGQWWPSVMWRESPADENQMIFEFDLSSLPSGEIIFAEFHFYIEQVKAMDAVVLETWVYAGNGSVGTEDHDAGEDLVGQWIWESGATGSEQVEVQQHVRYNVTDHLRGRSYEQAAFNVRLAGDAEEGFAGNVFVEGYNEHKIQLAANENTINNFTLKPSLTVILMPDQDTDSWQMKQKDIHNSGRAAYTVPRDRLNDTFFDDVLWQTPTTGAFNGSGFSYYDGVGPDGADVAVCSNTWPNRVSCVDRHTGKLFWQNSPGGGDSIGKITPAFSNDGKTIYVTTDSLADRSLAFSTFSGPGERYWGNSGEADPTRMSMLSPTVAPDGRIFMHKWNNACFAGVDSGEAITEVWAASEGVGICLADTALYQDSGDLLVIQTGRAGRVMAFDGETGAELWRVQTYQGTDCSATVDPVNGNIYYAAGLNRELYVVGLDKDGNDLWGATKLLLNDSENEPNRLERAMSTGCLSHDGRTYYFQSTGEVDNGKLYAINTVDGSVKWSYENHCKRDADDYSSSPVVTQNGVLVVGNVLGGQYLAIKDEGDYATLLDSITMEAQWNDPDKRQAKGSAVISADGKLYLPVRSYWTVGNGGGEVPDGTVRYCLAAFDLSGCDGPVPMDFNGDCMVNLIDFAEFASHWMACKLQPREQCY